MATNAGKPAEPSAPDELLFAADGMRARQFIATSICRLATNLFWAGLLVIGVPHHSDLLVPTDPARTEGLLIAIGAIPALVVPLIAGQLSDRSMSRQGRRRPYMVVGVLVNLLGMAVLWFAVRHLLLWLYGAAYILCNIGNNLASGPYSGLVPDVVPRSRHGEASGWMNAMTQVGSIIGLLGVAMLLGSNQEGPAMLLMGGVLVVCLWITMVGVHERPRARPPGPMGCKAFLKAIWIDPRQYPDFGWVWVTRALVMMGIYAVQPYLRCYLNDVIGIPRDQCDFAVGKLFACLLGCATVSGLISGRIADRHGPKRVVYVANAIIALACLAFPFGASPAYAFVVAAVFGVGYGAYYSADWALGLAVLPNPEDAGKDLAVWSIAMTLPMAITPPLAAFILGASGKTQETVGARIVTHDAQPAYLIVFVLAAFFLLAGAALLRNVKGVR